MLHEVFTIALAAALLQPYAEKPVPVFLGDDWTVTAYCSCEQCCGEWAALQGEVIKGAAGVPLESGYSCAAPVFDYGTVLTIDGIGEVRVDDRASGWVVDRYEGKIIDIYFDSHDQAVAFAKHTGCTVTAADEEQAEEWKRKYLI